MSRRVRIALIAASAVVVLALAGFFIGGWYAGRMIRSRIIPAAAKKLGRELKVQKVSSGWGWATLYNVEVKARDGVGESLVKVARVRIDYKVLPALWGNLEIESIDVDGARVVAVRGKDGSDNFSDIVDRLRGRGKDGTARVGGGRSAALMRPGRFSVRHSTVELDDRLRDTRISIGDITVSALRGTIAIATFERLSMAAGPLPAAKAAKLKIEATLVPGSYRPAKSPHLTVTGGELAPLPSLALTGIEGTIQAGARDASDPDAGERLVLDLRGGYGGVAQQLWQASGWVIPKTRRGEIAIKADRFMLDKLEPIVKRSPVLDPEMTAIRADLTLTLQGAKIAFGGGLDFTGLSVFHRRLTTEPIRDLSAETNVRGEIDLAKREVRIDDAVAKVKGIELRLTGSAAKPVGAPPRLQAHFTLPKRPCQTVLDAIPAAFVPSLQGFRLGGTFASDIRLAIDWADLDQTILDGSVGIYACKVEKAPEKMSTERLERSFQHHAEVYPGHWITFVVGPANPDYVPIFQISPHIMNSLMSTEDSGFYRHRGFIPSEFRSALVANLKRGYFRLGASSITMQMVKNVMMTREKTLSRKFQELFLTYYVEETLPKDRIMEIYLNVIEFGPEIYGIGPAMRHYFGKDPGQATPLEATFFSSILPNPKRRYVHRCDPELNEGWGAYLRRILTTMHKRARLTDQEFETAMAARLTFNQDTAIAPAECRARAKKAAATATAAWANAKSVRPAWQDVPDVPEPAPPELPEDEDLGGAEEPDEPWD